MQALDDPAFDQAAIVSRPVLRLGLLSAVVAAGLLWASPALADVPFYFVAATLKLVVWWTIPATLLIEGVVLRKLFALGWRRAALTTLGVNAASALLGVLGYLALLSALYGVFAPAAQRIAVSAQMALELLALWLAVAAVDVVIEVLALRLIFRLPASRTQMLWFALTNLLTVGLCVGALAWDMIPRPASAAEQARIERVYEPEIAWMRQLLQDWPRHVQRDTDGSLTTERSFSKARSGEARGMRFIALAYIGPAGAFYPVSRQVERHRWKVVARSTHNDVVFERWEGELDEFIGAWRAKPPPRFGYEVFVVRPDGRWRVEAMFDAAPGVSAEAAIRRD